MPRLLLVAGATILLTTAPAQGGALTDGSLGPQVRLTGDFEVGAELGTQRGDNLFHSFERFSLATGESATFTGPDQIRNVISRVTGGRPSRIDGALRSEVGTADLYFINPAGVLFGPNATLDVPASFHVSTADELRFTDGATFSAADRAASSLTVAAPRAFGFLGDRQGAITIDRSTLQVASGEMLSLVGGDIMIDGADNGFISDGDGDDGIVRAPGGTVLLASLASPGQVRLTTGSTTGQARGEISLLNQALVDTSGDRTGTLLLRGGTILMNDLAILLNLNDGVQDGSQILDVHADDLILDHRSFIRAGTESAGNAGTLNVEAQLIEVRNGSTIGNDALEGSGDAGSVAITVAGRLTLENAGAIGSATFTSGNAGTVRVTAGEIEIRGIPGGVLTGITTSVQPNATGGAGAVTVEAGDLLIVGPGALISSSTRSDEPAGSVDIETRDIVLDGSGCAASAVCGIISAVVCESADACSASGAGGSIDVTARAILLTNGATISSTAGTFGDGDAGSITVRAAGDIEIRTGATIESATFGQGDAGQVLVEADRLRIDGEGSLTGILSDAPVSEGGILSQGNAGSVTVAVDQLEIADGGQISTGSVLAGGGQILLTADSFIDLHDGEVTTSVFGGPAAGNIRIGSDVLVVDDGRIEAEALIGFGGQVAIEADNIVVPGGDFDALVASEEISATGGDLTRSGSVVVDALDVDLASDLVVLETPALDAAALLRESCAARRDVGASSFTGAGRGGLPASPDAALPSAYHGQPAGVQAGRPAAWARVDCTMVR